MKRLINRIKGFDPRRMIKMINVVKDRSGRSFIWILFDILRCFIKFGSGYMDYYLFYFEELSDEQKASYINISVNKKYVRYCNDSSYYHIFNNKLEFLDVYKDFIKRDYLDLNKADFDEFKSFLETHKEFMAKPVNGLCGYGIELIKVNEVSDYKKLYEDLINKQLFLLEERIVQNKRLNEIYPESINTIRVVTLNNDGNISILFKAIRIGNEGKHVDNFNNSGLFCVIEDDGVIRKPALNKANEIFDEHPMTHQKLIGFKIPKYNQIIDLVTKMAKVTPEVGLVGWDIAITDKSLDVVEGNEIPGYDIYQSKPHLGKDRLGIKKRFDDAVYPEDKDKKIFAKGHNIAKLIWIIFFGLLFDVVCYLLFESNFLLGLYLSITYIIFDSHIDSWKFYYFVLISLLIGVLMFIISYLIVYISISAYIDSYLKILTENVFSLFISFIDYELKAVVLCITSLYFIIPLISKFVEKINYNIGVFTTIVIACFMICLLIIVSFPIIYALSI